MLFAITWVAKNFIRFIEFVNGDSIGLSN